MDPAGLCFDSVSSENPYNTSDVLDKTDAKFVDVNNRFFSVHDVLSPPNFTNYLELFFFQVIHTNMGNIVTSGAGRYGSIMEAGHADFYRRFNTSF